MGDKQLRSRGHKGRKRAVQVLNNTTIERACEKSSCSRWYSRVMGDPQARCDGDVAGIGAENNTVEVIDKRPEVRGCSDES